MIATALRRVERYWQLLHHVPPRQLLRRVELLCRYQLAPWLPAPDDTPPPLREGFPLPPVSRPQARARSEPGALCLLLPWGERRFAEPIVWVPAAGSGETARSDWVILHYMEFLEDLPDDVFTRLLLAWIDSNSRFDRNSFYFAWHPYNLATRVVAWMRELARRRHRLAAGALARILRSLAAQIRFLERHLETDLRGNHLIRDLRALMCAGRFFAGEDAERWYRLGCQLLAAELEEQILADGTHYERSPAYHCQVLADLLECRFWLEPGPLREQLDRRLADMLRVAWLLSHPDGGVALFNDGGLSMAPRAAELAAVFAAAIDRPSEPPPSGAFALPDAGYFGYRDPEELFIVDCGPIGPDYLVGHGHCDMLSFEWSTGGRRIIVDPGTFQYRAGSRRMLCRSTASHNTVSLPGIEQSDIFGEFRCGRRARAQVRHWSAFADGFLFAGCHDGFSRLPGAPLHCRRIVARRGDIQITDHLTAGAGAQASATLLLHPDCRPEVEHSHRICLQSGQVAVVIEASAAIHLEPAEWHPDLYCVRPTLRLRLPFAGETLEMRLRRLTE